MLSTTMVLVGIRGWGERGAAASGPCDSMIP